MNTELNTKREAEHEAKQPPSFYTEKRQAVAQFDEPGGLGRDEGSAVALPKVVYDEEVKRFRLSGNYASEEEALDALAKGLGLESKDAALLVVTQALKACLPPESRSEISANAVLGLIADAKPKGAIEVLLVMSIVTAQLKGVEAFASAGRVLSSDKAEAMQALGAKHFKTIAALTDSLSRLRRGGTQNVIVKHLTVADGGQAMVGTVNTRRD